MYPSTPKNKPTIDKILIRRVSNFPCVLSKVTPASPIAPIAKNKLPIYSAGENVKMQPTIPERILKIERVK